MYYLCALCKPLTYWNAYGFCLIKQVSMLFKQLTIEVCGAVTLKRGTFSRSTKRFVGGGWTHLLCSRYSRGVVDFLFLIQWQVSFQVITWEPAPRFLWWRQALIKILQSLRGFSWQYGQTSQPLQAYMPFLISYFLSIECWSRSGIFKITFR